MDAYLAWSRRQSNAGDKQDTPRPAATGSSLPPPRQQPKRLPSLPGTPADDDDGKEDEDLLNPLSIPGLEQSSFLAQGGRTRGGPVLTPIQKSGAGKEVSGQASPAEPTGKGGPSAQTGDDIPTLKQVGRRKSRVKKGAGQKDVPAGTPKSGRTTSRRTPKSPKTPKTPKGGKGGDGPKPASITPLERIQLDKKFLATKALSKRRTNWCRVALKTAAVCLVVITVCALLELFSQLFHQSVYSIFFGDKFFRVGELFTVAEDGQVGVHTKDPQAGLDIHSHSAEPHRAHVRLSTRQRGTTPLAQEDEQVLEFGLQQGQAAGADGVAGGIGLFQRTAELRATAASGLSINATAGLTLNPSGGAVALTVDDTSSSSSSASSGKVGVGTREPQAKLHVKTGDVLVEHGSLVLGRRMDTLLTHAALLGRQRH